MFHYYLCNNSQYHFDIFSGQAAKKLSDVDYTAIGVAIGIFLCLSTVILVYLVRGRKRLQEGKLRTLTTISHSVTGHVSRL